MNSEQHVVVETRSNNASSHRDKRRSLHIETQTTFAELSPIERLAIIEEWQAERASTGNFLGEVDFIRSKTSIPAQQQDLLVSENQHWAIYVPTDNRAPFATLLVPKDAANALDELDQEQLDSLACLIAKMSTRYDNLMMSSVALYIRWHTSPAGLHATLEPQSVDCDSAFGTMRFIHTDFTAEQTARRLSKLSDIHFRDIFRI
ncbi:hypothetical protein QTP81_01190 [Alteromonas sp. ASW11-36]|uniref:Galactose-1-phosphate uridylyltransferase n=1 Tax=Alteromonas arenosi TaxID=3055817 RepID=A0ABT7SSQ2_9ALTE|nr:hypothetical protein [Alteromonas sp. ASW11-36]MDM7859218.1 hypothetical protein [Alteromonas sp. ASW11-36]